MIWRLLSHHFPFIFVFLGGSLTRWYHCPHYKVITVLVWIVLNARFDAAVLLGLFDIVINETTDIAPLVRGMLPLFKLR